VNAASSGISGFVFSSVTMLLPNGAGARRLRSYPAR